MDAPPTQYRVIERGGKLIVLDARTNLPPKQAAELHPGRQSDKMPERVSARDLFQKNAASKRRAERSGRSSTAMRKPMIRGGSAEQVKKVIKIPTVVLGLIVAGIVIGGFIGVAIAASAILYAGYAALKTSTPNI